MCEHSTLDVNRNDFRYADYRFIWHRKVAVVKGRFYKLACDGFAAIVP